MLVLTVKRRLRKIDRITCEHFGALLRSVVMRGEIAPERALCSRSVTGYLPTGQIETSVGASRR
jgi:hypothetical protein